MRRPLCALALLFAAAVFFSFLFSGRPVPQDYSPDQGRQVQVSGTVLFRTRKTAPGEEPVLLVTLGSAAGSVSREQNSLYIPAGQKVQCTLSLSDEAHVPIGARVCVSGRLYAFPEATNPGEFDSRLYYQILKTAFRVSDAVILPSSSGEGQDPLSCDRFGETLCRLRLFLSDVLDHCCGQEDAGVLKAMLLGEREALTAEMKEVYRDGGILHVLAVSGLHISLMGMGLYRVLRRFAALLLSRFSFGSRRARRRFRMLLKVLEGSCALTAVFVMICYGRMIGMSPSSFRAVFMFGMHLLSRQLGRTYDPATALSLSAVLLLLEQPLYLYHSGFLFSFSCLLGVCVLMPYLSGRILKGLAVPMAALPVQLRVYGFWPTASILLNLAVIPLMGAVMISGLLTLLMGGAGLLQAGRAAALPAHFILLFYHRACLLLQELPGSGIVTGAPSAAAVLCYVLLLITLICIEEYGGLAVPPAVQAMWLCCCILFLLVRDESGLKIHMLDAGQGDAVIIRFEDRCVLVDGGSSTKQDLYTYQLEPFLRHEGIGEIDAAVVSHDDLDHCSGLISLLEKEESPAKPRIGQIFLPEIDEASRGENYLRILELAAAQDIPVQFLSRGKTLVQESSTGKILQFFCVHPEAGESCENANEGSVTLLMRYKDFSMLLTGDLEGEGEQEVVEVLSAERDLLPQPAAGQRANLTVLKVAHHGSRGSTGEAFLRQVRPLYSLISAGRNNLYGHPHAELVERLEKAMTDPEGTRIFRTDRCGCITVRTDGRSVLTECFLTQ